MVYAAVVILWAAVLVPRWLRRHDRNATRRTTVTFHRAMATLERRRARYSASRASHNVDVVVAGARSRVHDRTRVTKSATANDSAIDRHLDLGIDPFEGSEQESHLRDARLARSRMIAREAAGRRRRQVRQALVALTVIAVVLHVMGPLPLMLTALPPLGLAAFWFATRQVTGRPQTSRGRTATPDRRRRSGSATGAQAAAGAGRSTASNRAANRKSDRRVSRTSRRYVEPVSAQATGASSSSESTDVRLLDADEIASRQTATDSGQWEAVEATLPSHVVGPRIDRRPTTRRRGDWTAERMLEQVEALRAPGQDPEAELGLDEYVDIPYADRHEHLRAVND